MECPTCNGSMTLTSYDTSSLEKPNQARMAWKCSDGECAQKPVWYGTPGHTAGDPE